MPSGSIAVFYSFHGQLRNEVGDCVIRYLKLPDPSSLSTKTRMAH